MKRDCSIRPFKSMGIYEYNLKDQIIDINSREEIVRQWLIKELNSTYGYPLKLLKLEYQVQQFSQKGYVDISVNIYINGEEIPYIFAEVKKFGSGIGDAISQVKSYMQADSRVRYGVVTDGLDILIIDKEGEKMSDIPRCNSHFLPEDKEKRTYINFNNNKKYLYTSDKEDNSNIDITDYENNLYIELDNIERIPVVGEVAAGIPIEVNIEYNEHIDIPKTWILSPKDTFALKVTGDSMDGIGIDRGDTVMVHRQNTAINGDIVVAAINSEATIKKFMLMGSSVLLLSENPNYEPIQMNREDIVINGRVIGVMKKEQ